MSRPPRFTYPGALHHVTLRCNNREFLFAEPWFSRFAGLLQEARERFPLRLYNYCLLTNHVHLLFDVGRDDTLSKAMHWLSSSFVRQFNTATGRLGHLWQGRFRSAIVEDASYFFRCMAYVDLNPVRAGIVAAPVDYPFCGHRALQAERAEVLDLHDLYLDLGSDAEARYGRYQELLAEEAARPAVSLAEAYFVGTSRFVRRMQTKFATRTSGRSVRTAELGSGLFCVSPWHGRAPAP
jgi:putative transposase